MALTDFSSVAQEIRRAKAEYARLSRGHVPSEEWSEDYIKQRLLVLEETIRGYEEE